MHIPRYQKTYLSREMTRAMALDHPIGDPHGGPAYGERNEPISAIIAVGTMFASVPAAGFAAMTVLQGITFAGAALSLVGNITGNKTLSKIGMVAGIAGGLGSIAESAGWISSGNLGETLGLGSATPGAGAGAAPGPELTQTPTANPTPSPVAMDVQSAVPQYTPANATAATGAEGLINNAAPQLNNVPLSQVPGSPFQGTTIDFTSSQVAPGAQTPVGAPAGPTAPGVAAPSAPSTPFTAQTSTGLATLPGDSQAVAAARPGFVESLKAGNYGDAAMTAGSNIMDLAKSNPGAAYMLGQAAGGVADVLSGKTGAQIDALEAQGQLSKAQADRIRYEMELSERRRKQFNTNMGLPLNMTVNPNSVQFTQPGLINGARTGG